MSLRMIVDVTPAVILILNLWISFEILILRAWYKMRSGNAALRDWPHAKAVVYCEKGRLLAVTILPRAQH